MRLRELIPDPERGIGLEASAHRTNVLLSNYLVIKN